jgi:Asp-tRNA(Asn)/Glu-tRNA(Gln) amidotransferase A subunit family amidase
VSLQICAAESGNYIISSCICIGIAKSYNTAIFYSVSHAVSTTTKLSSMRYTQIASRLLCLLGATTAFDPREATIASVHHDLYTGLVTCREVVESFLARIETLNNHTNAILALNSHALSDADACDKALALNNATFGPLFGIPILLKDNFDTSFMPTTGANADMAQSQPRVDAPAVKAFKKAGAIILGKTNLHELALEGISVSSLGGQTINPYDSTRTPGGSSGGTGAAIAASFAVWGTGSDTVNSLRSPASANSLWSLRPTRGLVSRAGIIPISYTQDTIGPIARCVEDVATALTVMAGIGYDADDNTTASVPAGLQGTDYAASLTTGSLTGLRFGLIEGFFNRTSSNETTPVNDAMSKHVARLRLAGVTIVPINETIYDANKIIAALDVQRYEYRELLTEYLQRPTLSGEHPNSTNELYASDKFLVLPSGYEYVTTSLVSSTSNATYVIRQAGIQNLSLALEKTFAIDNLDAIIYPEQKNLVVKVGSPSQSGRNGILAALTGTPVITVPIGFSPATETAPDGVPIGMEILGRQWTEEKLLQIAWQIQQLCRVRKAPSWAKQRVGARGYESVPSVTPNVGSIPDEYLVGEL